MSPETDSPDTSLGWQRQWLYIVAPFVLLLLCLALINLTAWLARPVAREATPVPMTAAETAPAVSAQQSKTAIASAVLESDMATWTPLPADSAVPVPTVPPEAHILLHGPPDGSSLPSGEIAALYWSWPLALAETHQFAIYLIDPAGERQLGTVAEPNLGAQYRWPLDTTALVPPGVFRWQIRLESTINGQVLAESKLRRLSVRKADQ